jgi:hypothetical protein
MEVTIRVSSKLAPDVWDTQVDPDELSVFGRPLGESGLTSVIQVIGGVTPIESDAALRFDHRHAHVLNRGTSGRAIVIVNTPDRSQESSMNTSNMGDQRLLAAVSTDPHLYGMVGELMTKVRAGRPGNLRYYEKTGKYIETPDNYWGIRPQRTNGSLRIFVRGNPEHFGPIGGLEIKPDMNGYSAFKISSAAQIDDAITAIMRARRR